MKILFRGLGPNETVSYKGLMLKNGAAIEMEDAHAKAYVDASLAVLVTGEKEVKAAQRLEEKNADTRRRVKDKATMLEKEGN